MSSQSINSQSISSKSVIYTDKAPEPIGSYSQAIKTGSTVYLSGQIPLCPQTMELVSDNIDDQIHQSFKNLLAVCEAAEASLNHIVKLNIYLIDLANFAKVNSIMAQYFQEPMPARAAIGVAQLPRGAKIEVDGVLELGY